MEYVFLNDRLVSAEQATVSVHDAGLLHGVGLFETMRSYNGRIFMLDEHLDRLYNSANHLGIQITQTRQDIHSVVQELQAANGLTNARLRLTVTRGNMREMDEEGNYQSTMLISAGPVSSYPREFYRYGMLVVVCDYRQPLGLPTSGHKTLNYFDRLIALREAQQKRAGEALWFTADNRLAEGCISNIFIVKDDVLLTPPIDTPILPGIIRQLVLDLADEVAFDYEERALTVDDLMDAGEVFLTNSIMELIPVTHIEGHNVGAQKPGPVYRRLHQAYRVAVVEQCGGDIETLFGNSLPTDEDGAS